MYLPDHFKVADVASLQDLIRGHPLGVLFTNGRGGMDANHIPFFMDRTAGKFGTLQAHVARSNPLWEEVSNGDEVLVVFRSADAYITPTWYPSKLETHRQVPTWNYLVAHAHGRIRVHDDERFVRDVVARLTAEHEGKRTEPWKMSEAPQDYMQEMIQAIVGIEVEIVTLLGKYKLSQDDGVRDMRGAGLGLQSEGEQKISAEMLRRSSIDR